MQYNETSHQYSKFAPFYQEVGQKRGHFDSQALFLRKIFDSDTCKNCTVLDSSCASGDVLLNLSNFFPNYILYGTDGRLDFILQAKKAIQEQEKEIKIQYSNWLNLGDIFELETFDYIYNLGNSLGHAASIEEFTNILKTIRPLLKENGHFIFDLRDWHNHPRDNSFNEPYLKSRCINLKNNIRYATDYCYDNQKHCLIHTVYKNNMVLDVIKLCFFDYSNREIEEAVQKSGFCIVKKYSDYNDYPFLSYRIKKCK
jgi:SAM-dependent methyltransferase